MPPKRITLTCRGCGNCLPRSSFSANQLHVRTDRARCTECCSTGTAPVALVTCSDCGRCLPRSSFSFSQLHLKIGRARCTECCSTDNAPTHLRICTRCGHHRAQDEYPQREWRRSTRKCLARLAVYTANPFTFCTYAAGFFGAQSRGQRSS